MNLAELRQRFKAISGREELSNSRIDYFINNGVRLLDRMASFANGSGRQFVPISLGDDFVLFSVDCVSLKEVWCIDSVTGRSEVKKIPYWYLVENKTAINAKPDQYCLSNARVAYPVGFDKTQSPFAAYQQFIKAATDSNFYRGIELLAPADNAYLLDLEGKFYSPKLTDTVTQNWWSVNYEMAVLNAALYMLYDEYKNTEGMATYMTAIKETTTNIDYDLAEEEAAGIERMEG